MQIKLIMKIMIQIKMSDVIFKFRIYKSLTTSTPLGGVKVNKAGSKL